MEDALWITVVGMGLVFAAIVLLWGLMALLVRLAAVPEAVPEKSQDAQAAERTELRRRVAVAAVAAALAMEGQQGQEAEGEAGDHATSWQVAQRAAGLNKELRSPNQNR